MTTSTLAHIEMEESLRAWPLASLDLAQLLQNYGGNTVKPIFPIQIPCGSNFHFRLNHTITIK